jgi:hypothetical protein
MEPGHLTELIQDASFAGSVGFRVALANPTQVLSAALVAHDVTPLLGYILDGATIPLRVTY